MTDRRQHVLVVEDNAENRYLTTVLLQSEGYLAVAAVNGVEALALIDRHRFAFVLLDLQLPEIDGFEIARSIRRKYSAEDLPIIAVSALASPADRREAFAAGCTGYLEKPIDAETFVAQVRCLAGIIA